MVKGRASDYMSLDCGNAQVKALSNQYQVVFPHGLVELTPHELNELSLRGELGKDKALYCVNGTWYKVGQRALQTGSASLRYGESRYVDSYYGVLAAVAMFEVFNTPPAGGVFIMGSHTPKDAIYRQDLILSVRGSRGLKWSVEHMGVRKDFTVTDAAGIDEPVGVYRHAVLADDGSHFRADNRPLRKGVTLILDIGGFTSAWSIARDGLLDYAAGGSHVRGILHVLDDLEALIRSEYRQRLKGAQRLDPIALRAALKTGKYDAAGAGKLDVAALVNQAVTPLMNDLDGIFQRFGGLSFAHSVLLGGGGGAVLEGRIRESFQHPRIVTADPEPNRLHFATAEGGLKTIRLLVSRGEL